MEKKNLLNRKIVRGIAQLWAEDYKEMSTLCRELYDIIPEGSKFANWDKYNVLRTHCIGKELNKLLISGDIERKDSHIKNNGHFIGQVR